MRNNLDLGNNLFPNDGNKAYYLKNLIPEFSPFTVGVESTNDDINFFLKNCACIRHLLCYYLLDVSLLDTWVLCNALLADSYC